MQALPPRPRSAHKGTSGRLLLLGGGPGMSGAIRLASEAALRVGAGLVYVAAHRDSAAAVRNGRPEAIVHAVEAASELSELIDLADAAVVGPGLGRSDWARACLSRLLESGLPLVADADALNLVAATPAPRGNWAITPHPGEAARLLGRSTAAIQQDRERCPCARSRVATEARPSSRAQTRWSQRPRRTSRRAVCDRGNPGMASGGMGDVLAGVIGSLLVQSHSLTGSVRAAVLLHALAGDAAARDGERGTLASDLFPHLRRWANPS